MKLSVNDTCPCESKKKYKKCCKLFHNGKNPQTALELMKSRYSAFAAGDASYIIKTTHEENIEFTKDIKIWKESILDFCKITQFKNLEIISSQLEDEISYVTFKVSLFQNEENLGFTEKSKFIKIDNRWFYHSGEFL